MAEDVVQYQLVEQQHQVPELGLRLGGGRVEVQVLEQVVLEHWRARHVAVLGVIGIFRGVRADLGLSAI